MRTTIKRATLAVWNFLAALGFIAVFFSLIWFMDKPQAKSLTSLSDNPSGRPPPIKRYLPKEASKKPPKPSKAPKAPRIPPPEFKSLNTPSKLPTLKIK